MPRALAGASWWLPLYLVLTLASAFVDLRVRAYPDHAVTKYMPEVVAGTAEAPGRYRVLAPFVWQWTVQATGADPMSAWYVTRLAWFLAAWLAWHAYLSTWFAPPVAALGTGLVAALLPLTYTNSWAHPDHIPELALFTLASLAIARRADGWTALLIVVNACNRETSAFLLPLYLVAAPLSRSRLARLAMLAVAWAAVFLGLRTWRGFETYDYWQLWRNLEFLRLLPPTYDPFYRAYAWFPVALFGTLFYLAARSRRTQPAFVRGAPLIALLVGVVAVTISSIIESRIFTPLFALLVPGVMFTLFGPINGKDSFALQLQRNRS